MKPAIKNSLIISFFLSTIFVWGQKPTLRFELLNSDDGLSGNTVNSIHQDKSGFLWLGTQEGLNLYNGYEFIHHQQNAKDTFSISSDNIDCINSDTAGNLWIGTFEGINFFNKGENKFYHTKNTNTFKHPLFKSAVYDIETDKNNNAYIATGWMGVYSITDKKLDKIYDKDHLLTTNTTTSLYLENNNTLWIGTSDGLSCINMSTKKSTHYLTELSTDACYVNDIYFYKNRLWLATKKGLIEFNLQTKKYKYFFHEPNNPFGFLNDRNIRKISADNQGNLWLATEFNGVICFNTKEGKNIQYLKGGLSQLPSNQIRSIHVEKNGSIWLGTNLGLSVSNIRTNLFASYSSNNKNAIISGGANCLAIQEDNIWIGSKDHGLAKLNLATNKSEIFTASEDKTTLSSNEITTLLPYKNELIIGTQNGLNIYTYSTQKFTVLTTDDGLSSNEITSLLDVNGSIWIGYSNSGLQIWNKSSNTFKAFNISNKEQHDLPDDLVTFLYKDSKNTVWVGTHKGISYFDHSKGKFITYSSTKGKSNGLISDLTSCFLEDTRGNYWVGTAEGLSFFNKDHKEFSHYTIEKGLSSNLIYTIKEDNFGKLWIGTDNGIDVLDMKTKKVISFSSKDGIQGKNFARGSSIKNKNGLLYFGGDDGFTQITPQNLIVKSETPKVHITGFKLFNKNVRSGINSVLNQDISKTKIITLDYNQNFITLEFTGLNYITPEKTTYKYRLKGFNEEWITVKKNRSATYTNLPPGNYIFQIKAYLEGEEQAISPTQLFIEVTPPFWSTWWFRIIVIILLGGLVYLVFKMRIRAIKERNRNLEKKVLERTKRIMVQKEEIEKQKSQMEVQRDQILYQKEQIMESIEVGRMIQFSVLPSVNDLKEFFKEAFIYYAPKDIVSGDFYWFHTNMDRVYIAAADCTGHGVAGAFLTMIGQNHLNDIVENDNTLSAAEILDQLNERMITTLRQRSADSTSRDGMDITLCILDQTKSQVEFAGAVNPLYVIRKGASEIEKHSVNAFSIGIPRRGDVKPFTNYVIDIFKGDRIYLFSDGYADQFGGPNGDEKFKLYRFRELILDIKDLPFDKQGKIVEENINYWMKDTEQTDDMMLIGIQML